MPAGPRSEYERRRAARGASAETAARRAARLANLRLAVFALVLAALWLALVREDVSGVGVVALAAVFAGLVIAHDRTRRAETRARRAERFYARGLARLDYAFAGQGNAGERFADPEHPYADHLDLFGSGSVFELLCGAQTPAGEETLARWLKEPAGPEEVRARQVAAAELRDRLDLREDLAALGPDVREGIDPGALAAWGREPPLLRVRAARLVAPGLVLLAAAAGLAALLTPAGPAPLLGALGLEGAFALAYRSRVRRAIRGLDRPLHDLALLAELLARVEAERFEAPALVRLRGRLERAGAPPSREIARLRLLVELLQSRRNQLFAPLSPLLLWATQLGFAIDAWRERCGPELGRWLEALGEIEALLDLAGHAHEHPDDPFPELCESGARFDAQGLAHPLLDERSAVRNDLRLDSEGALLIVSGSNMSGKTTLLRSVGTNAVLALAGAPVRAERLALSPLAVAASLVVRDSLQEGASRFYAEIRGLRRIVELTRTSLPVLFLLDEILAGTNSHDRGIGAAAVVRSLVERGALGMVTTHDLALARIADDLAPRAANVHFEDQLDDGRMRFDYQLRPGVVTKSNALELMRSIGLEV